MKRVAIITGFLVFILFCIMVKASVKSSIVSMDKAPLIPTPTPIELKANKIQFLVNTVREDHGLSDLTPDKSLCELAQARIKQVETSWSQESFGEIAQAYITRNMVGENTSKNYTNEGDAVVGWINSPEHYINIVNPSFTKDCVVTDGSYAVQEFSTTH